MEYCSPIWVGAPASHLWKPRHFGPSASPATRLSLWASHSLTTGRSVIFLSSTVSSPVSPPALSAICPHHISSGRLRSANNSLLVKLPKSRIVAHLHSFIPLFSHFWNKLPHSLQSHSSLQVFKTAVHHHLLSPPIQNFPTPTNPPQIHLLQIPYFPS